MTQFVQVPGIGPVGFPDGTSQEEMAAALQSLQPRATEQGSDVRDSFAGSFLRGLRDPVDEGARFLTRGLEAVAPAGSAMEDWARSERQRVEAINQEAERAYRQDWRGGKLRPDELDVGRLIGNVAATAAPGTGLALRAGAAPFRAGAIGGAVAGALEPVGPVTSTSDYFAKKAEKTGAATVLGGASGKLLSGLGQLFFGQPQAAVTGPAAAAGDVAGTAAASVEGTTIPTATVRGGGSTLGRVGPDTPAGLTEGQKAALAQGRELGMKVTPGQETGSRSLQQMEARMESNPFFSGPFNAIKQGNQKVLNRAAAQAIGEDADELSAPILGRASERLGKVFDEVASPKLFPIDGETMLNGIALTGGYYDDVAGVAISQQVLVKQVIELAAKGNATGEQLRALSSKLGRAAKNQSTSASGNRELGQALMAVKEHVDDALASTLTPAQKAAFDTARQQYRNLMTLEGSGVVNPSSGNVSGQNLAAALQRRDKSGFFYGGNTTTPMYQAARFAQAFKPLVGDSGTATRSMELTPLNMMLSMPTNLAARAYTSGAARAAARAATGPGMLGNYLDARSAEALRQTLPAAGGAAATNYLLD